MKQIDVSFVIGSYNRVDFLKLTIESVRSEIESFQLQSEIIVVDGGSDDGTISWLTSQKDIVSIIQHNRGQWKGELIKRRSWGYFMNLAFKCAQGRYVCMLSDDCLVVPGSVNNGLRLCIELASEGRKIGGAAFYWRDWPEMSEYMVGSVFDSYCHINHGLYFNQALKNVGYIDEDNYDFYHADTDLALRIWMAGYEIIECSEAFIEHYSHANVAVKQSNMSTQPEDWRRFLQIWGNLNEKCKDVGVWKKMTFEDLNRTANLFSSISSPKKVEGVSSRVKSRLSHYINTLRIVTNSLSRSNSEKNTGTEADRQKARARPWFAANGDKTFRLNYPELGSNSLIVDLGGYEGQWASDVFSKYCSEVWIFEPYLPYHVQIKDRFAKNDKIRVFDFGLGKAEDTFPFSVSGDSSSAYRDFDESVKDKIVIKEAKEFFEGMKVQRVDLMKINIEGGEYDLLEHLIETGWSERIVNIQVQFHEFVEGAEERMKNIQQQLQKTHSLTYQFEFIWENWKLKG